MNTPSQTWNKEVLYQLQHDEAYASQFIEKLIKAGEDPTEVLEKVLGVKVSKEHRAQRSKQKIS